MKSIKVIALGGVMLLAGCSTLAPQYQRPVAPVPDTLPGGQVAPATQKGSIPSQSNPLAKIDWRDFFRDQRLQKVISLALDNNRDLRVAVLNIEKAREEYRIQGADLFPSVAATGTGNTSHKPASGGGATESSTSHQYSAEVGFSSYELDLFGRIRSLKKEALETYLSDVQNQRSTRLSLVAEVAGDWLTLVADERLLKLANDTLASREKTLKLTQLRHQQGVASGLDLASVQAGVETARGDIGSYKAAVAQARNALTLVVGTSIPQTLMPSAQLGDAVMLAKIPSNLSSAVLLQRPDVMAAEHTLKAANADIGAARAAFFPTISLTAAAGFSSGQLSNLFSGNNGVWSFAPSISLPIFNTGSLEASLQVSKVQRQIDVANYESTIQTAFREVADALAVRGTLKERLKAQQALVDAYARSYGLTRKQYLDGVTSYLDVLDTQRSLYSAQQSLITLQLTEYSNRVTLYKVLGGGADAQAENVAITK